MSVQTKIINLFLFALLYFGKQDAVLSESFIKSPTEKPSLDDNHVLDHSSNEIPLDEIQAKLIDEHHYYLPMQTTFGSYLHPSTYGASITSPPHITPASVHNNFEQKTESIKQDLLSNDDHVSPYLSYCVSETPLSEKLGSDAILSSKELIHENLILSGHTEIVSKTDSVSDASRVSVVASESSVPFQRTHIYMPTVTDL
ncbi:uncharacterized protein CDAR_201031 [Caerostris darwini]|uniref:Uncharacterized protein n=1 Tax=Caerostris darwini TaxID=1538125 RepID=A0AAV4P2L4_9ARAC|nr:uncharacterized protein CDAR_201031 [Caerostris darwini]